MDVQLAEGFGEAALRQRIDRLVLKKQDLMRDQGLLKPLDEVGRQWA